MHKLILASESPRRKKLLEEAGFLFHVFSVKVSEHIDKNLMLDEQILQIAKAKAEAAMLNYNPTESQSFLILSADTLVILASQVLGKPLNSTQAEKFLGLLSGKKHLVKTAIFLQEVIFKDSTFKKGTCAFGLETTEVYFRPILRQEILDYIATGEPMDKAGAYGIQGIGKKFVEKYVGPYDNVVGLPILLFEKLLEKNNWHVRKNS